MTRNPKTIAQDVPLIDAARLMPAHKISTLPVVADGRLVGMITESDVFRAFVLILLCLLSACEPSRITRSQDFPPVQTAPAAPSSMRTAAVTASVVSPQGLTSSPASTQTIIELTLKSEETRAKETLMPYTQPLSIKVVFDNNPYHPHMKTAWGFSALITYREETLLFDTGGDGAILLDNMRALEIDPLHINRIVLSHAHGDHTGGLSALLDTGTRPKVFLLPSFPDSFKNQVRARTEVVEVTPGLEVAETMFSTGEMGQEILEQALVIKTVAGLVIITGCAHPGIVKIVQQARSMFGETVHLVLGGFHLRNKSAAEIDAILTDFRRMEVQKIGPCHCTGEQAIARFAAEFGEDFLQIGVGSVLSLDGLSSK